MKVFWLYVLSLVLAFQACRQSLPEEVKGHYASLNQKISYNNDARPILSDRCFSCHGPDANSRKAELRLDIKPSAEKLDLVIDRILSEDPDFQMPPPDSKMDITDKEKATIIKWIKEGAKYEQHWAFIPPMEVNPPETPPSHTIYNDIDRFIINKLIVNKLPQSEKADKERLLRRVTFDLTGLPPSISEIDDFLADLSDEAYEKVVDRLLNSKEYGERMAMEWMDVARYADSHGVHADGYRLMWPWRDWVINAFNENLSYRDFVTWQIAGDMLPNATYEQKLATGFNRNHIMSSEAGVIDEEFRLQYVNDRAETFSTVFLGLTAGCARCHDHKFDPISQKEFYELGAFFNNVKELGMTGNDGNNGPLLPVISPAIRQQINELDKEITALSDSEVFEVKEFVNLLAEQPIFYGKIDTLVGNKIDNNVNFTSQAKSKLVEGYSGKAAFLTGEYDELYVKDIPTFQAYDPFGASLYINTTKKDSTRTQTLLATSGDKNNFWSGWDFYLDQQNRLNVRLISSLPHNYIHARTDEAININEWTKVGFTYDGKGRSKGISFTINDEKKPSISEYDHLYKSIHPTGGRARKKIEKRPIKVGKSYRSATGEYGVFKGRIDEIKIYYFPKKDPLRSKIKQKFDLYNDKDEVMVMEEMPKPRKAFIYNRGEYDQPTEQVFPATPAVLNSYPDSLPRNRLGLTQWLFDPENPLTARVTVNRYWQMVFGKGIVESSNDFGLQGSRPSHPELLDHLALELIKNDWDLKWLLKQMVMSYTYQQSSNFNAILQEKDPGNKLLARGPSYRMQAEMIRDNALAASGILTKDKGGESVRPYQPEGLWIEKSSFSYLLLNYKPDQGDSLYRRSLYTFIRRTSPNPSMTIFDAPTREFCVTKRENTSTPLQALVLLNDPQFVEAARIMAERIQAEGGESLGEQIKYGFRLAIGRAPTSDELDLLSDLYKSQYDYYQMNKSEAKAFISVGEFRVPDDLDVSKTAALAAVTSTLINHNESYMKR
jgi:cytochrome c553